MVIQQNGEMENKFHISITAQSKQLIEHRCDSVQSRVHFIIILIIIIIIIIII